MATASPARKKRGVPEVRCANCGHADLEHGKTGTKPCLATVGEGAEMEFCFCDEFRPKAVKAA